MRSSRKPTRHLVLALVFLVLFLLPSFPHPSSSLLGPTRPSFASWLRVTSTSPSQSTRTSPASVSCWRPTRNSPTMARCGSGRTRSRLRHTRTRKVADDAIHVLLGGRCQQTQRTFIKVDTQCSMSDYLCFPSPDSSAQHQKKNRFRQHLFIPVTSAHLGHSPRCTLPSRRTAAFTKQTNMASAALRSS